MVGRRESIGEPVISPELAEVLGVLLGDGCVFRYGEEGNQINGISFTGHETEFWYYRDFVKPALEAGFSVHGHLMVRNDHTTRYRVYSKRLVSILIAYGIPVGKKKDGRIPPVVLHAGLVVPFIRGLYHAEGCIYRRYSKKYRGHARVYNKLHVLQIRMKLGTLMRQVRNELLRLGISTNRLCEKQGVFTLRITSQAAIAKFMDIVQPRFKTAPHPTSL